MKETKWGKTMLQIYVAGAEDELLYNASCDEELSRWLCQYSDEPREDLTDRTDWMIDAHDLGAFLEKPDDAMIRNDQLMLADSALKEAYAISEIESFVVCTDRAIALFQRGDDGKFSCSEIYSGGHCLPQCFWEVMYPDTCQRAIAKIRGEFFPNEVPTWYFLGREYCGLYMVTPEIVSPCMDYHNENGEDITLDHSISDGLNPAYFHERDNVHWRLYFDLEVLEGTSYAEQKLDTPEKLLLAADRHCTIEWLVRDGYYGILTSDEYYDAIRELKWQEYHRTHPEVVIA